MKINLLKRTLIFIKRKLFATYEYNTVLNDILFDLKGAINSIDSIKESLFILKGSISESNIRIENLTDYSSVLESKLNAISRSEKRNKIVAVFLVNNINAWHSISKVILELNNQDDFNVVVASINKKFPGQEKYEGDSDVHSFLESKGVSHIRLGMPDSYQALDILLAINPTVIFRQSQWDVDYPPAFSYKHLNFCKLALIPYEISNLIKNVEYSGGIMDSATDSLFHRSCWAAYCSSEYMKNNAKVNGVMQGTQFIVTGHPKVDYLLNVAPKWPFNGKGRKRILWSPHHSIGKGWSDFGVFPDYWEYMIELSQSWGEVDFVFCPHPALVTNLKSGEFDVNGFNYESFISTWASNGNCFTYFGADYAEICKASDIILTDGISMLLECQFLEKDIIFIEREGHVDFNRIGELLKSGFFTVSNKNELTSKLEEIMSGLSPSLNLEQRKNINELFPTRNAVKNIINHLRSNLV